MGGGWDRTAKYATSQTADKPLSIKANNNKIYTYIIMHPLHLHAVLKLHLKRIHIQSVCMMYISYIALQEVQFIKNKI